MPTWVYIVLYFSGFIVAGGLIEKLTEESYHSQSEMGHPLHVTAIFSWITAIICMLVMLSRRRRKRSESAC